MTHPSIDSTAPGSLRRDALAILAEALRAVDPARLVAQALADDPEMERWGHELAGMDRSVAGGRSGSLPGAGGRTLLVAVGKAALGMTRGALHILGDTLDRGVVLAPHGVERPRWLPPQMELRTGGHPIPDEQGSAAAEEVAELVSGLTPADRLLVLISGGGSALLTLPRAGISLEALRSTTGTLLRAGLSIHELNRVRSLLEELKGGGLARRAAPGRILGLILSDVVGDDPAVVASGPLTPAVVSRREVEILLRRRKVWDELPGMVRRVIQEGGDEPAVTAFGEDPGGMGSTRPGPGSGAGALVRLVGGGGTALDAAAAAARARGYATEVLSATLEGEARKVGRGLARVGMAVADGVAPPTPPACLLAAGETTVHVRGPGKGGRNQEVALAAGMALEGRAGIVVASLGTDGVDGPTDAAGALADGSTAALARAAGWDPGAALADNDAYPLLDAVGGLIRTGPTGTNVADLMLVLVVRGDVASSDARTALRG